MVERETGNELTTGVRFDVEGLIAALGARATCTSEAPDAAPDGQPLILATGGFGASRDLLREHVTPEADAVMMRAAPGSTGDGLRIGLAAGGQTVPACPTFTLARCPPRPRACARRSSSRSRSSTRAMRG